MDNRQFEEKWQKTLQADKFEETDIFVPLGYKPVTQRQLNFVNYHKLVKSFIGRKQISNGLELGCGRGTISLYLSAYEGVNMTLLDIAPEAIEQARQNFTKHNQEAEFVVADSANLPFPDNCFDLTVSMGLLEHLPDYPKTIAEQLRVLKPGGMMISMNVPGKFSVQNLNSIYRFFLKIFKPGAELKKDYYRNNDKPEVYLKAAQTAGFVNCYAINANPVPLFAPMGLKWDKRIAKVWKSWIGLRSHFMSQPYKTNYLFSQCHFLAGYKKEEPS